MRAALVDSGEEDVAARSGRHRCGAVKGVLASD
jgi:hypothetical protein